MTASTARDSGMMMVSRIRRSLAPSMRADSVSSGEIPMKNARSTRMLKTLTALGRISYR